jgi:uncharacterized protein with HEPN domain
MSVELVHSELDAAQLTQLTLLAETLESLMHTMSAAQVRTHYRDLEILRDGLSHLLDKADGKK